MRDVVVCQNQRYMGYVLEGLPEEGQGEKGLIIRLDDDNKLRRALSASTNIELHRYSVTFKLLKGLSS